MKKLLKEGPKTVNIGLRGFYDALKQQKSSAIHVVWRPPIVKKELLTRLRKLRKESKS
jgi:hypothetical protein